MQIASCGPAGHPPAPPTALLLGRAAARRKNRPKSSCEAGGQWWVGCSVCTERKGGRAPHFSQPNLPGVLLIIQEAFHGNADISEVSTAVFSSYSVCTVRHRVIKASGPRSFRFWVLGGWLSWSWAGEERIYLRLKTMGAAELRKPLEMTAVKRGDSSTQRALEKCIQQLQAWEDLLALEILYDNTNCWRFLLAAIICS